MLTARFSTEPGGNRWSNHLGREKKPRLVGETIIFWAVLKPVSNIVNAYDKIRPLLTSKMNN